MKINFNKENVLKFLKTALVGGSVLVMVVAGSIIYKKVTKKEEKYPILKQIEVFDDNQNVEVIINGVTYVAPEGYTLEVVNGNVHAVRRYMLITKPEVYVDDQGKETYITPPDYVMIDGLLYRELVEYKEPIVVNSKVL